MHLLIAWVASAFAGFLAERVSTLVILTAWNIPAWERLSGGLPNPRCFLEAFSYTCPKLFVFRPVPLGAYPLVFFLVFQLVYGGLLYLALRRLGLFNLPPVLLAYLVPALAWAWIPIYATLGVVFLVLIPPLAAGTALALVGWLLARPQQQRNLSRSPLKPRRG